MSRHVPNLSRFPEIPIWERMPGTPEALRFNLAESTVRAATMEDVRALMDTPALRGVKLGYTSSAGLSELRQAIGRICGVPGDMVLTTPGAAFALFLLAFELCRPGDDVLVATPCFAPAHETLRSCGAQVRTFALRFEDGYRLDPDQLAGELREHTRLVSLCSPHNPSGVHVERAAIAHVLDAIARICPHATLLVDETFREATYGNALPAESVAGLDRRVVTSASISKAYGVAGLRVGWLTVPDPVLRGRLTSAKANILISGSMLDEQLGALLLASPRAGFAERAQRLADGHALVADWQRDVAPLVDWVPSEAGALCAFRLRPGVYEADRVNAFWDLANARGIRLAPGGWFGDEARVFRVGFGALPIDELRPALSALAGVLRDTQAGL